MDGWLLLGILIVVGIPVSVIFLLIGQSRLRGRVGALEAELARLRQTFGAVTPGPIVVEQVAVTPPLQVTEAPPAAEQPEAAPAETDAAVSGPWFGGKVAAIPSSVPTQDRPLAISSERFAALTGWLRENWVLAVAALSLALAGVFFVQYGVERGLLPPPLRVLAAILFGAALVAGGEWVRRRHGDEAGATAFLPSTFSGAGVVSIFAGVLAARQMYGLIGVETAMLGLVLTAVLALVLGWYHGPFLAAIGLIGATAAPFVVGGDAESATWLYAYFALIAGFGLGIDALRRWAWVSVLALALPVLAGGLLFLADRNAAGFGVMLTALVMLAIVIPQRQLTPAHGGHMVLGAIRRGGKGGWPSFPTRMAAGTMAVATVLLVIMETRNAAEGTVLLVCLFGLALAITLWAWRAPALADLAGVASVGFVARIVTDVLNRDPLSMNFQNAAIALRAPETSAPGTVTMIVALTAALSAAAGWRSLRGKDHRVQWAALAVILTPTAMLGLEMMWSPAAVIGAYGWALHAMVLAAGMVGLAAAFGRADATDRRRAAYATLAALTLIPFALFAILTKGALTLALAALVAAAAALDRRFRLPELGWFLQAGTIVLGWRLFADPGVIWAYDAPLFEVALSFLAAIAAMSAGLWLLRGMNRRAPQVFLESGLAAFIAVFADVLLFRWLDAAFPGGPAGFWAATLFALPWLVVALVQLYRAQLGGVLAIVRKTLAVIAGIIAAAGLGASATILNPLISGDAVGGPLVLDTLLVAYGLPSILLIAAARWFSQLAPALRSFLLWAGVAFGALFAGLEIRRFWQGDVLSNSGMPQGELYTYTLALMLIGAVLLYQAIASRSALLRGVGMGVIALTIAKVFLIDASGLTGLTRVFAFLGLGLSLAGLAWLNRWAAERSREAG